MRCSKGLLKIFILMILSACVNVETTEMDQKGHSITVEEYSIAVYGYYGDSLTEIEKNADVNPIFTDHDIEYIDWSSFRIYFTEEFLSGFDIDGTIENYDLLSLDGLRIYSEAPWDNYAFLVNDEIIFTGEFPVGLISSYAPIKNVMLDEVDGVRISAQNEDADFLENNERILAAIKALDLAKK